LPQDATDVALVERVLAGETDSFEPLVRRYERVLFTVALRMLGNRDAAADAAQNAFVKAFEKLGTYDPRYRFFSWIYRIVLNECLNVRRAQRPMEPLDPALPLVEGTTDPVERSEQRGRIQAALLQLPVEYRQVIVLRYFADLSYEEMAVAADVPVKTVKSRLYSGRQQLAVLLRGERVER
jgi:RNA polymerase sigma-70 factor (ECF subfamily)